jgi:hypothetical protein
MAHGDAREEKWGGNKRMEWVTSKLHMTAEHWLARAVQTLQVDVTAPLPVVDWTDAHADLNGLVHFAERWNLVSARVSSHFKRSLTHFKVNHSVSDPPTGALEWRVFYLRHIWVQKIIYFVSNLNKKQIFRQWIRTSINNKTTVRNVSVNHYFPMCWKHSRLLVQNKRVYVIKIARVLYLKNVEILSELQPQDRGHRNQNISGCVQAGACM